ncbi:hypothetical protein [Megasphaera sp. DISK 18]|uniref:hypothetical protein n=1 Tax=Megasphaera sp. DISK 18 TaxID=1776081 RepID=UPI000806FFE4|nr:hypothetical protein [Megasphaera sp. DISK 18]OBZ32751.1 hypothetical protein A0U42_01600 [Megasphaera sp. DISK 18]
MANEENAKTVEQLQEEIAALKQELADFKQSHSQPIEDAANSVVKAMEQTTEDKDVQVEMLCRWAAARAGAIVIAPLIGTAALMANEVYLVSRIAKVYDVKLSERALIAFLGAVGSRVAGTLLTTLIPFSIIQVPVAVGITYSLGRVTQRWLKDGMPTDMGPYIEMMGEWKDKAREQADKLKENPLKNVPLGDETIDFMKKWGGAAKDCIQDVKEKGEELYNSVVHKDDLVDEIVDEKAEDLKDAAGDAKDAFDDTVDKVVDSDAMDKAKDVARDAKDAAEDVKDAAKDVAKDAKDAKDAAKDVSDMDADDVEKKVKEAVEEAKKSLEDLK